MPKKLEQADFAITTYDDLWKRGNWYKRVSNDPVTDLQTDLVIWRNRSQFLAESNVIIDSANQNYASTIIGKGLTPSPKLRLGSRDLEKELTDEILEAWDEWQSAAHIDGQTDLPSLLRAIVAAIVRDGDVLVYLTTNSQGKPVIDLISANRIETPPAELIPQGKFVYLGVQVSATRETEGYWVKNSYSDSGFTPFDCFDKDTGRIKSVLLKNPANTDRLNSYRGKPLISSCLGTVDKLDQLIDANLKAEILKTLQLGVHKTKSVPDAAKANTNPINNIKVNKVGETNILTIPSTDEFTMQNSRDTANPTLPANVLVYLRQIASKYNMPYNVLWNDLSDNTYSSNSSIFLVAWQNGEIWRSYLVHNLLKPLYSLLLESWCIDGTVSADYSKQLAKVQFSGKSNYPIRAKDIFEGESIAIQTNQKSLIQVATENGLDAYTIIDDKLNIELYEKQQREAKGLVTPPEEKPIETKIETPVTDLPIPPQDIEGNK